MQTELKAPKTHRSWAGPLAAILSAILFGTMPLMTRYAFSLGSNPFMAVFGRFSTGALVSCLVILLVPGQSFRITRSQLSSLVLGSLFYAATPALLYSSYQLIDSGLASTLHFTYPVTVMVLSVLLLHEKVGKKELLCGLFCMGGILLLYTPGQGISLSGMVIAALSGLVYACYILLLGRGTLKSLSVLTLTFWLSLFSSQVILLVSLLTGNLQSDLPVRVWIPYLGLGVFATVLALALFQLGVFLCGPVKASLFSTFEPLTGVAIGVFFFHERLTPRSCLGILLILAAVSLLALPGRRAA